MTPMEQGTPGPGPLPEKTSQELEKATRDKISILQLPLNRIMANQPDQTQPPNCHFCPVIQQKCPLWN